MPVKTETTGVRNHFWLAVTILLGLLWGLSTLAGCSPANTPTQSVNGTGKLTVTPSATSSPSNSPMPPTAREVWHPFKGPKLTPAIEIPPPFKGLWLPDGARVLALLGTGEQAPFIGSSEAVMLALYHPRNQRVSFISIPPDLFVYIPGYTMQRISAAFAAGGAPMFQDTVEYNLGMRPDSWVFIHTDSLEKLVDSLGGLYLTPLEDLVEFCPRVSPQLHRLDGKQVVCYITYRYGGDERSRSQRQQQVLQALIHRIVDGGNLVLLDKLLDTYMPESDSSFTRDEVTALQDQAMQLAIDDRMAFFALDEEHFDWWEVPGPVPAPVFLPDRDALGRLLQAAANFIATPGAPSNRVLTLVYELTQSPTPTETPTMTITITRTSTPFRTRTMTRTITRTFTRTPTRTMTSTPTVTHTATITSTPTATATATDTATPTITSTSTEAGTPTATATATETLPPGP